MAILATSLAAIFGAAYALTADMPWPDAVYIGSQQGMGALVLLFLTAWLVLLLCIPVLPIVIIGIDALLGIVDGIRDVLNGRRGSAS